MLAGLFLENINWQQFWLQFLNVHVLLFGGATAYNSWWDKDDGPIGGLKSPPKMNRWMWPASMGMQYIGLAWAVTVGWNYAIIYALSMLFFWLYSTPLARWKGKPVRSIIAIGISTGTNSFLLGFLAAGGYPITFSEDLIAIGVAAVILSLYPVSQVYQTKEDAKRGDHTFAGAYGLIGVKWFYTILFFVGILILTLMLREALGFLGTIFGVVGYLAYLAIAVIVWRLEGDASEYGKVMRVKFMASFSFVIFILTTLGFRFLA